MIVYSAPSLQKTAEHFDAFQPDPGGSGAYVDQRLYSNGGCLIVTGRTSTPLMLSVPTFTATPFDVPAPVRAIASSIGKVYLLTDDSIEVLASEVPPPAPKRRAVR
jgi:hypothetical protein